MVTGRRMLEFSVTGDEDVELTAMSLDESERCLLTGLQDGTVKMWNHSIGECLLTFPSQDQLEVSPGGQPGPGAPLEKHSTAPITRGHSIFCATLNGCA